MKNYILHMLWFTRLNYWRKYTLGGFQKFVLHFSDGNNFSYIQMWRSILNSRLHLHFLDSMPHVFYVYHKEKKESIYLKLQLFKLFNAFLCLNVFINQLKCHWNHQTPRCFQQIFFHRVASVNYSFKHLKLLLNTSL